MARLLRRFLESFLRTLACNRPRNHAHWRHWMRTSNFSADRRFDREIVVSVPSLKRGEKICLPPRRFSPDIARNCECLQNVLPKCACLRALAGVFVLPEIRGARGRRALLRSNCG